MPCYHPLHAWGLPPTVDNGKWEVRLSKVAHREKPPTDSKGWTELKLPCGKCIGCRLERSRQWAMRMQHEASLYDQNCFITLTYSPKYIPEDQSLNKRHFQLFMKRLRKANPREPGNGIRFFHCGEYGDQLNRPHYHACLFNFDFGDKKFLRHVNGNNLYTSEHLNKLWTFPGESEPIGYSTIGALTFESAAYVARYCTKKVNGNRAAEHYQICDPDTGEVHTLEPEYCTMSRRPGIAADWYKKYKKDCYPKDFVTVRGIKMKPPRFYDQKHSELHPNQMEEIKEQRMAEGRKNWREHTLKRLLQKEKVKEAQFTQLTRGTEKL